MNNIRSFQRFAAVAAIISGILAFASLVPALMAVDFHPEATTNMRLYLETGSRGGSLYRMSMILDILGYYLLIVPLTILLWHWFRPKDPGRVDLYTLCLLAYSLVGAMGAAILAEVIPPLIVSYGAVAAQKATIELIFDATNNMVYGGLWNTLEVFIVGIGWIGMGLILRHERPAIGIATVILGGAALADFVGNTLGIEALSALGLYVYLVLAPVWALWLGIDLLRKPVQVAG
jgi:hypothetical protein